MPPYIIQKCYVVYFPPEQLIWNGRTFDNERDAIDGIKEFFGFDHAWHRLKSAGWIIKRASLSIKI